MKPLFGTLALTLLVAACGARPELEVASSTNASSAFFYTPPPCSPGSFSCGFREGPVPPEIAGACRNDRWVGYQLNNPGACAPPTRRTLTGRWVVRKLFPNHASMPPDLQRFCLYQWRSRTSSRPVIRVLPNTADMRLERDCEAVTPLFTPGPSAPLFEQAFASQMLLPEFPPQATLPTTTRVRVAVVDTSPTEKLTGLPSPGADGHGFVVGAVARDVSCLRSGAGVLDCAADIVSYQGMPLGDGVASFGRPTDVARAMFWAITDWIDQAPADRLLINLSLGWDGRYSGLHGPEMRITALAPWLVAQWAACQDVLIVAASGNRSQINASVGPMFPGGWESDTRICPAHNPFTYAPVIHAAGALDGRDEILRMVRPGGLPRMLAPSAFVTAHAPTTSGHTIQSRLVSGTSLSAAALSGTAAMVWAFAPDLTPEQVMEQIYRGGVSLSEQADFAKNGFWPVARVDTCSAVHRVCQATSCPAHCTPRAEGSDDRPNFQTAVDLELPGLRAGPLTPNVIKTAYPLVPSTPEISVNPYAGPQPGGSICPLCGFDGTYLVGQLELTEGTEVLDLFLRPKLCSPEWCDEELGGVKLEGFNAEEPFKIDMSDTLDTSVIETALLEVTTMSKGEVVVRAAELFVY